MSIVPKETIEVIAQSIGVSNLVPDVLPALASDVEYRVREIMQEAIKCMRHSKRTTLTADDVESALKLRNVEPIYGFTSGDSLRFQRAAGHKDLFYVEEKDVEFKDVIEAPLPKNPLDTAVIAYWLAIEGVQPAIPENVPIEALAVPSDHKKADYKEDGALVDIKLPVKHVLSRELQLYFDKITELTVNKSSSILFKEALMSLATDSGLHPLVPYFTYFIADEVARNLNNFPLLFALMRLAWSLLQNLHIHIEPYLHQLMPSVITCLVAKRLGNKYSDNHWELRDFTANLVASICKRFGHVYHNLQSRVTRTLLHAFLDPTKTLPQHYGAIQGLASLGPSVVRLLVLPNLEPYLQLLETDMKLDKQKNEMKRHEAWRVYGALTCAAGLCIYDQVKMFSNVLFPTPRAILKSKAKVLTAMPNNKRKASTDSMKHQPPLKKIATEGQMGIMPTKDVQGATGGFSTAPMSSDTGLPSISRQLTNGSISGVGGRREKARGLLPNTSTILAQAWKEDMDAGNLLPLLFEYFGESMFSFIPMPELSFFV
ncbi:transcription initiation factor TFIID subunit 6-like isoform X1 [Actinidia eriantha]|uniref:transcription initiation factor TFIID subunit 6-like isoform X1 n=1 Tax=Actinidia eriantha TaxID=165200 RepID=UPI0025899773|nr:transcription initiation factor TFIID subunit 6-like isoform X1 [Actinidia eriantha]